MKRSDRSFEPFMTGREAGQLLGLSHRTFDRYRAPGRGPAYYKFGGAVRYRRSDVIAWAERRQRGQRQKRE
ncbi:MAG: helix-turn-helix domain-containing protein [Rhodospirillales bacterium]|nr:helix-turn-helix domain-containing protein [Rhodospirillales bacterium]MCY4097821.1 helix-turn-helix domain-containing protein [Rhodospirillales bacterium]